MTYETIRFTVDGHIARMTLNRPRALNAISPQMLDDMQAVASQVTADPNLRVLIIAAEGRAFCAGADLKAIDAMQGSIAKMQRFLRHWKDVFCTLEDLPRPVIGVCQGLALAGGFELLQVCDFVIASDNAQIGDQHINFGLVPGGGGSQRLPRLIGIRKAKELMFTGVWLNAMQAYELDLVNKVVAPAELENAVQELATTLAAKSPIALRTMKRLINSGMQTDLEHGLELELHMVSIHNVLDDTREGIAAFKEKRQPVFKGVL
ncbi:MAG: enoyl-CoA hydratase/isomerase family protein [bacterium]|nr:enoyl-CoA hydratase/isomerase family protein [bacterium]